jgi:large subunit ribosomal protein L13
MSTRIVPTDPAHRTWYVVDARSYTLGRLASQVARVLRGKHKPEYSPHQDHGDHVVVLHASGVRLTGKKLEKKTFFRHTGYIGAVKWDSLQGMMDREPEEVIRRAVRGMLPKSRLGRAMIKKLKVYPGGEHPHTGQRPVPMGLDERGMPSGGGDA